MTEEEKRQIVPTGSVVCVGDTKFLVAGYRTVETDGKNAPAYVLLPWPYGDLNRKSVFICPLSGITGLQGEGYRGEEEEPWPGQMEGLLPVGSIVRYKEAPDIRYMIAGYYPAVADEIRDYAAVRYPVGLSAATRLELFDQDKIGSVLFVGYQDEASKSILRRIPEFMQRTGELMRETEELLQQIQDLTGEGNDNVDREDPFSIRME